jgi:hypothetical protein
MSAHQSNLPRLLAEAAFNEGGDDERLDIVQNQLVPAESDLRELLSDTLDDVAFVTGHMVPAQKPARCSGDRGAVINHLPSERRSNVGLKAVQDVIECT